MTKLKPCPFCGGKAEMTDYVFPEWGISEYNVFCGDCGTQSPVFNTPEDAAMHWNSCVGGGKFTDEERNVILEALRYYRDDATHTDSEFCGLDRDSEKFSLITTAMEKIRDISRGGK